MIGHAVKLVRFASKILTTIVATLGIFFVVPSVSFAEPLSWEQLEGTAWKGRWYGSPHSQYNDVFEITFSSLFAPYNAVFNVADSTGRYTWAAVAEVTPDGSVVVKTAAYRVDTFKRNGEKLVGTYTATDGRNGSTSLKAAEFSVSCSPITTIDPLKGATIKGKWRQYGGNGSAKVVSDITIEFNASGTGATFSAFKQDGSSAGQWEETIFLKDGAIVATSARGREDTFRFCREGGTVGLYGSWRNNGKLVGSTIIPISLSLGQK